MRRRKYKNRTRKYKNRTLNKHRQTNRRRVRRTKKTRMKMNGGSHAGLLTAEERGASADGAGGESVGAPIDIKKELECSMEKYSSELGENAPFGGDVDRNTLLCIEEIKALRPLDERIRTRSIFMTTGFSYCYMFEEFIDEDYIMFCDWGIRTLKDTKKLIVYGIARRNYELSKSLERGAATIDQVMGDGGIIHWYNQGPLPRKKYIFLHMNLNDNRHITTLLETINRLGFTITTNNLSNVPDYIRGEADEQPYYRFFGNEPAINTNCMYICGLFAYYFNKEEILEKLKINNMFCDLIEAADSLGYPLSRDRVLSNEHWKEFDNFWPQAYQKPGVILDL